MNFQPTKLPGVYVIEPKVFQDIRGSFVKVFQRSAFDAVGFQGQLVESYYSTSQKNVIRGMHFQAPPAEYAKLVYVTRGSIVDAVVDIRQGSPTYGQYVTAELSATNCHAIFIPAGFAHGFLSREDGSCVIYAQTAEYAQDQDSGVHARSCGIPWGIENPILSKRDSAFPTLEAFQTPFTYRV